MMKTNRFGLVEEFKAYTLTLDPESSSMPSQLARQQRQSSPQGNVETLLLEGK